jgi:hypothetical protein
MTHAEMDELYELYALGVLESEQAVEIEQHLRDRCSYCLEHVYGALQGTAALSTLAAPVQPPRALRDRVLASVRPVKRPRAWTFALAGLSAACLALLAFSLWSGFEMNRMHVELADLRNEGDQLRAAIEILSRPDTRAVEFGRADNVPHGRVLVNRRGGLVFVGSQLPALASDKTFELWLIPAAKGAAPQPAGLFRVNAAGDSVNVSSRRVDPLQIAAVAVTVEPLRGSNAPTTKPFLIVPIA